MSNKLEDLQLSEIEVGGRVLIAFNPHEANAEGILGTITDYRPGQGFFGCDLVDVEYAHPTTGEVRNRPFSLEKLKPANPSSLIAAAEKLEAAATELRALAEKK